MERLFNDFSLKTRRRKLRNNPTYPEEILWSILRNRQCCGVKFRRQCSIGKYIVDFYSFEKKLAIEIDGDSHFSKNAEKYDCKRTEFLNENGINVLRFTNEEVMNNLEGCFLVLEHCLLQETPFISPFQGEGFSYFPVNDCYFLKNQIDTKTK